LRIGLFLIEPRQISASGNIPRPPHEVIVPSSQRPGFSEPMQPAAAHVEAEETELSSQLH
jgi:hypothetical protein